MCVLDKFVNAIASQITNILTHNFAQLFGIIQEIDDSILGKFGWECRKKFKKTVVAFRLKMMRHKISWMRNEVSEHDKLTK